MNETALSALLATAALIGFVHTITGPDHYVPFVAMARVGRWSLAKTVLITLLCGVGHVLGSVGLGAIGIAAGLAVGKLSWFETIRGSVAGWLLLGFGLAYLAWGVRHAIRNKPHTHKHIHPDGTSHVHIHTHSGDHTHLHADSSRADHMTPWILFTIFVFGPCEPLIPILMYPAAKLSLFGIIAVALLFAAVTLITMVGMVVAGYLGFAKLTRPRFARFSHAFAGFAIAVCGAAVQFGL